MTYRHSVSAVVPAADWDNLRAMFLKNNYDIGQGVPIPDEKAPTHRAFHAWLNDDLYKLFTGVLQPEIEGMTKAEQTALRTKMKMRATLDGEESPKENFEAMLVREKLTRTVEPEPAVEIKR